jgi:hypothetical protein
VLRDDDTRMLPRYNFLMLLVLAVFQFADALAIRMLVT